MLGIKIINPISIKTNLFFFSQKNENSSEV